MNIFGMGGGGPGIQTGVPMSQTPGGDAGTPPPDPNNQPGNNGSDGGNAANPQDNAGQGPNLDAFWTGNQQPQPGSNQGQPQQGAGNQLGQQIVQQLQGLKFDPIMTPDAIKELNEGKFDSINQAFQSQLQNAVQQSMVMNIQIMKAFQEQVTRLIDSKLGETLTQRDNYALLESAMPSAKDARTGPVVRSIYDKALENANGNREKALEMTRAMWSIVARTSAGETGLLEPPNNGRDSGSQNLVTVESLLGRQ